MASSIRRKPSGRWEARYRDELGRQRGRTFDRKRDAQRFLDQIKSDLQRGTYIEPSRQTLGEFLEEWLQTAQPTVRPSTWKSYGGALELAVQRIGRLRLCRLDGGQLNALYAQLLSSGRKDGRGGLSPRTVRYTHTVLHRALGDAVRWGRLPRNPAEQANPPKQARPEMTAWTADELRTFLRHTRGDRLHAVYVLAVTTGMRRGELLGLRWQDVDLDAKRLAIRRTLISAGYELRHSEPKTARSRRNVALDVDTVRVLREHHARQAAERLAAGQAWIDNGLVFTRRDGAAVHPQSLYVALVRHAKAAGVPVIRVHDLRHTYATLALEAGVHPKVVADRLGHASIAITLDTYSHVVPSVASAAADVVAGVIFGER